MGNYGIVPVMGAEELQQQKEQEARQSEERVSVFNDNLTGHIRSAWQIAKEAKRPIEQIMIRSLRQRNGIYEADKIAAIREMGGSEIYVLLTLAKCRAAEAWINDVLRPAGDKPWSLEPTPIPELNPIFQEEIQKEIAAEAQALQQEVVGLNIINVPEVQKALSEYAENLKQHMLEESICEAKEASEKMSQVMLDQQIQGYFTDSFKQVINDIITLKAGILKGPVLRSRKEKKYVFNGSKWEVQLQDTIVPEFDRVSPFDFYPAAGSTGPDDGDIIERHYLTRSDLVSLIGVPGYKESAVREALSHYDMGTYFEILPVDTQRYLVEHGETGTMNRTKKIEALEYWGSVPGKYLTDWGLEGDIDPELEYEINAWMIKDIVIKAVINPDKLGRKPYSVTAFEKIPGSIWGKGIPELMADIQDVCNAVARAIVNNAQLASGPMVEVNVDKCASNTAMYPWKIFQATNQTMNESPAIHFYQPQMYVAPLQQTYEFFSLASDEATGVPRWAYGNTNVGGAGSTSSGLSMLMTYAARGIKQVIQSIDDDLFTPTLQRQYDYNMVFSEDESIKGDVQIIARGSSSLIAREQQSLRIKEALQVTANPIDLQLLGLDTRLEMIKKLFKAMDIELESMPDPENIQDVIEQIKQQIAQQQQQMAQAQAIPENQQAAQTGEAPAAKGPQMDNSGQTMGGKDQNLNLETRAGGGPMQAGKPYLVGEQGPELVVPTSDAVILPTPLTQQFLDTGSNQVTPSSSALQQLTDYGRNYGVQTGQYLNTLGRGAEYIGLDRTGQVIGDVGKDTVEYWNRNITPETRAALEAPYFGRNANNEVNSVNVRKVLMEQVVDPADALLAVAGTVAKPLKHIPSGVIDAVEKVVTSPLGKKVIKKVEESNTKKNKWRDSMLKKYGSDT